MTFTSAELLEEIGKMQEKGLDASDGSLIAYGLIRIAEALDRIAVAREVIAGLRTHDGNKL